MRKLLFPLAIATQLGATDCGTVISDPGFDLWCGDSLCSWKLVRGEVRRAATWHEKDTGVELVGTDSAIQQVAPVNSSDGHCIRFSLISDVDESAEVYLDIDLQSDGSVELHERIATTDWQPSSYLIFIDPPYDGIRFELTKRGAGKSVLAQIHAELSDECVGLTPIASGPRPDGSSCSMPEHCASGLCAGSPSPPAGSFFGTACASCDLNADTCGANTVCGLAAPVNGVLAMPLGCVAEASKVVGERCTRDAECASGTCSAPDGGVGACSACDSDDDCTGVACKPAWNELDFDSPVGPLVCGPGQHLGAPGTACATHADCASGTCNGAPRSECADGRACQSNADCGDPSTLEPGGCTTVGVQGGSCS